MKELRDKNGKTEEEFLREYDVTKYFRPSVTVDGVLYSRTGNNGARILMIKRGGHPYIGMYAFPGGFVEADEPCETAAARELFEETGIEGIKLYQLITASTPDRDPRWRNITVVFAAELNGDIAATAGDDAADAEWFDISLDGNKLHFNGKKESFDATLDVKRDAFGRVDLNETKITDRGMSAFDHAKIVYYLLDTLRGVK